MFMFIDTIYHYFIDASRGAGAQPVAFTVARESSFSLSGNEANCGVEFRHSMRNIPRIWRKVRNEMSKWGRCVLKLAS